SRSLPTGTWSATAPRRERKGPASPTSSSFRGSPSRSRLPDQTDGGPRRRTPVSPFDSRRRLDGGATGAGRSPPRRRRRASATAAGACWQSKAARPFWEPRREQSAPDPRERPVPRRLLHRLAVGAARGPVDQGNHHPGLRGPSVADRHRRTLRPDIRAQQRRGLRPLRVGGLLDQGDHAEQRRRPRLHRRLGLRPALLAQERASPGGLRADPGRRDREPPRPGPVRVRRGLPRLLDLRPPLARVQRRGLRDLHRRVPPLPRHAPQRGGKAGPDAAPSGGPGLMFPRLVHIGSFYLPTYGVVLAIAYLTGIWLLRRKAVAAGLPDQKILDLSLYIL